MRTGTKVALLMGGAFSPAKLYRSGENGLWLDPSDMATAYQDSAATTAGAVSSPVGKRLDKSGRGNHVLQATSAARPTLDATGVYSDVCDGIDDGYKTAVFAAGTLTNNMDCFIAVKRTAGNVVLIDSEDGVGATFFGTAIAGGAGLPYDRVGTPTTHVDGVALSPNTRGQLSIALTADDWHILETRNLDLSLWTVVRVSQYGGGGDRLNGGIGGVILCPAQSETNRAKIRKYLGRKVGLSL